MIYWQDLSRLIRTVSRIRLRPTDISYLSSFLTNKAIPWEQLIKMAEMEGVAGLMYYHLSGFHPFRTLHGPGPGRLKEIYQQIREENIERLSEAERISKHLEASGLSGMVLQGLPVLRKYRYLGLRPMGDMDILVRPDEKACVIDLLQQCGFTVTNPVYPNILYGGGLWLDIHTHVLNLDRIEAREYLFPKELSSLWQRAKPFLRGSKGLLRPDPYDELILQAAHTLKHSYDRMIWLVDLGIMLESLIRSKNDWKKLIKQCRFWHQEKVVLYSLIVLEGILGFEILNEVKSEFGFQKLNRIEKYLLRLKVNGFSSSEYCMALWIFTISGFRKRLAFVNETLFPRQDIMDQIYSRNHRHPSLWLQIKRGGKAGEILWQNLYRAIRFSFQRRAESTGFDRAV